MTPWRGLQAASHRIVLTSTIAASFICDFIYRSVDNPRFLAGVDMSSPDAAEDVQQATLAAVLEQVPALLQAIDKLSLAALLSSCREIRQLLHTVLTGVHLEHVCLTRPELKLLLDAKWPELQKLSVNLSNWDLKAAAELGRFRWPFLRSFSLARSHLQPAAFQLLMCGRWQTIQHLNLRNVGMDTSKMLSLVEAHLPSLQDLNLSHNSRLTPKAIARLASADWPQLTSLNLSFNDLRSAPLKRSVHRESLSETSSSHCSNFEDLTFGGISFGGSDASNGLEDWTESESTVSSDFDDCTVSDDWPGTDDESVFSANFATLRIIHSDEDSDEAEEATLQAEREDRDMHEGVAAIKHLVKGQWPKLVSISVEKTYIGEIALAALLHGQWLQLHEVNAGRLSLGNDRLTLTKPGWKQLTSLQLNGCDLGSMFLTNFAAADWPHLQSLRLSDNYFYKSVRRYGAVPVSHVLGEASMTNLTSLHFSCNSITDHQTPLAFIAADWPLLQSLTLYHCSLGHHNALHTLVRGEWPQLTYLNVSGNALGDTAVQMLSQAKWPKLRCLDLSKNHVKFAGVKGVIKLDAHWLEKLDLSQNSLYSKAYKHLLKAAWPRLTHLDVSNNAESAACFRQRYTRNWLHLQELTM